MDERKDHLWKVAQEAEERIEDLMKAGSNPVGLDVGTSKVVAAKRKGKEIDTGAQLNAFIPVPYSRFTETHPRPERDLLLPRERRADHLRQRHREVREHVQRERAAADGGRAHQPARSGSPCPCWRRSSRPSCPRRARRARSSPSPCPPPPRGTKPQLTYHEATLRRYFESLGYKPVAINEGLAVIFSELEDNNFTGIGISCGGGMCNVTLAYLSIPSHHVQHPEGRRLHRRFRGLGHERARHAREGASRKRASTSASRRRTSSRRRSASTTRTSSSPSSRS